jgi:diguanylate cyclase (GGDEF)-like protein
LFYQSIDVIEAYGLQVLDLPRGPWGILQHVTLLAVMAYALIGVYRKLKRSQGPYRSRARYMLAGLTMPVVVYATYALGIGPVGIDLMPFSYVVMSVLVGIGLFQFDMLLVTPVTYEMIFRSIDEGVLVIDHNGLVIRANDAAKRYFPSLLALKEGGRRQMIQELMGFDFDSPEYQWAVGDKVFNTKRMAAENQRGVIYLFNDVTEAEKSKRELEIMATVDPLTGIQNRRVFMEKLENAPDGVFAILDLDHFKEINDQKGHHEGDRILKAFAQAMRKHYSFQKVCRYGGEEFAVFFPKATLQVAYHSLELFRVRCIEDEIGVRFSAGMAAYRSGLINPAILEADKKLYEAKEKGRDQIQI